MSIREKFWTTLLGVVILFLSCSNKKLIDQKILIGKYCLYEMKEILYYYLRMVVIVIST